MTADHRAGGRALRVGATSRPEHEEAAERERRARALKLSGMNGDAAVFVVDDDDGVRESLRSLLASVRRPVETYATGQQFLDSLTGWRSGCLIVDVRMPGMSALDLQDELATRNITLPIIMITGYADVQTAVRALRAGAFDFLEKPISGQLLLDRVRRALELDQQRRRVEAERAAVAARIASLTRREREVMHHVVAGKTNKSIAIALTRSKKTIEVHRARVMRKMRVDSVAELVRLAWLVNGTREVWSA